MCVCVPYLCVQSTTLKRRIQIRQALSLDTDIGRQDVVANLERLWHDLHATSEQRTRKLTAELAYIDHHNVLCFALLCMQHASSFARTALVVAVLINVAQHRCAGLTVALAIL
jgi:hypothetical protein